MREPASEMLSTMMGSALWPLPFPRRSCVTAIPAPVVP
jgi:hypothetical protein